MRKRHAAPDAERINQQAGNSRVCARFFDRVSSLRRRKTIDTRVTFGRPPALVSWRALFSLRKTVTRSLSADRILRAAPIS
jgi:hypothetical protein